MTDQELFNELLHKFATNSHFIAWMKDLNWKYMEHRYYADICHQIRDYMDNLPAIEEFKKKINARMINYLSDIENSERGSLETKYIEEIIERWVTKLYMIEGEKFVYPITKTILEKEADKELSLMNHAKEYIDSNLHSIMELKAEEIMREEAQKFIARAARHYVELYS